MSQNGKSVHSMARQDVRARSVQMLGEQTWQERDAAAREAAVEIDD